MSKVASINKLKSTESLLSRNDVPALTALTKDISNNLVHAATVIDAEDFEKLSNIQNLVSNKEMTIDSLLGQEVQKYNTNYKNYKDANDEISSYGWSCYPLLKTTGLSRENQSYYNSLYSKASKASDAMNDIGGPIGHSLLDVTTLPTISSGTLKPLVEAKKAIGDKNASREAIVNDGSIFDISTPMTVLEGPTKNIAPELFQFGRMPAAVLTKYGLYNNKSEPLATGTLSLAGVATPCYAISYDDGPTKKVGYIPTSQITLDNATGQLTVGSSLEIYDLSSNKVTPKSDYSFELHVGVDYNVGLAHSGAADFKDLHFVSSKALTVKRSVSSFDKTVILTNPAFTQELTNRLALDHRHQIASSSRADSKIALSVKGLLDKHPEYVKLPDSHKESLYTNILGLPYSTIPGTTLATTITPTQAYDISTGAFQDHSVLFSAYIQSKSVNPMPTADDLKNATNYRNWLSRNLSILTKNYFTDCLESYLNDPLLAQAINDQITQYTTNYETQKITPLAPAQLQTAAVALRRCLPKSYGSSNINNSWMRLMAGKGASISDSIDNEDGTSTNYTTAVQMRTGKGVSVNISLGDEKPIILAGATPGDILAKILTGCGGRVGGDRERMMLAFSTMKAIVKTCKEAGIHMTVPVNGTNGDELRVTLDDKDNIRVARYNYNATSDSFDESATPGDVFDEMNPDHKHTMTPQFLVNMNRATNTMLDNQYAQFRGTMNNATSTLSSLGRIITFDRERMSYKANPRWLRGLITKFLNRKENPVEEFSFPVQTGNKTANVTYNPNGTITIEIDGKIRKGKNLAKLLNPWSLRSFGGIFARQKNITDGLEMSIMQGLYEGLSGQLMDNSRVNTYTYLVRDPRTQIVYAMYQDDSGKTQIGIIENVSRNIGPIDATRTMIGHNNDIPLLPSQNWGRCKGMPPQTPVQLNDEERAAVMARPEIMDGFMQNMLKAREEIISVGVGKYRRASLTAMVAGQFGTAVAIGAFEMGSGGLLTSGAYTAGQAVNTAVIGAGPSLGSATKSVLVNTGTALKRAIEIPINFGRGLVGV